jgi:hypothetical protein
MALSAKFSDESRNAACNAHTALLNSGKLRIYDGTQAATADTAIGAQVLLAELTFNATAFGAASAGVATANAITQDSSANATGTASWYRCLKSDGTSPIEDGSVGTATSNLILNSVAISSGAAVQVSSFTHTENKTGT